MATEIKNDFDIVDGRYRLKVIKSDTGPDYPDDEAVMKKISGNGEEDVYVIESETEEHSDYDDDYDEDSDDDIYAGYYGQHKKFQEFYIDLFDVKVTITDEYAILAVKFTLPEDTSVKFAELNNGISQVEVFTEAGESVFRTERKDDQDQSLWFSDKFIDQFDDQDLVTMHNGKKVWALKWSKPIKRGNDNGTNQSSRH